MLARGMSASMSAGGRMKGELQVLLRRMLDGGPPTL